MRKSLAVLLCLGLFLPCASRSARLYLKDGSIITGELVASNEDSVVFRTSFKGRVAFVKQDVLRIDLSDAPTTAVGGSASLFTSAEPGSLQVLFHTEKLSSKVIVHRDHEKEAYMRANSIEQKLFVDNEQVFSCVDSLPEKTVRNGPDTIYKNTMALEDIKVQLLPGSHSCRIVVENSGRRAHRDWFDNEPLYETLEVGSVIIYPGKTTTLSIDVRKRRWGLGETELRLSQ
jgi:hypothetical protein